MQRTSSRILFVEDNDDIRFIVQTLLKTQSYEVSIAASMTSGLQLAQSETFDLYLFDTNLPDGSGKELCGKVREFDRATPIIIYSGESPAERGDTNISNIQGYVMKPDLEGLRKAIFRAMSITPA
jgi:DNA-binding response OmpR family regulator